MKKQLPDDPVENARRYPDRLSRSRRKYLYTKPFGENIRGDDLVGKFHDFAFILEYLSEIPGSRILDVGCGPGWLSEFLIRMGFSVTGIDVSPGMIRIARKRLHKIPSRWSSSLPDYRFLVMDAHELNFNNTFDAAIIYDTLHHFEREEDVLKCVYTSLKPGGRLFLKEPPETHPESPGAQAEMKTFGVLEKGFSRNELQHLLGHAGFEHIRFHLSAAFLVPEDKIFGPYLEAIVRASHREHLVTARKPPVVPDSRNPSRLDAQYKLLTRIPETIPPGTPMNISIEVMNTGDTIWLAAPQRLGGHVRLAVVLEKPSGDPIDEQFASAHLDSDIYPGQSTELKVYLKTPGTSGDYILRFNLITELLSWFDAHLSVPFRVTSGT